MNRRALQIASFVPVVLLGAACSSVSGSRATGKAVPLHVSAPAIRDGLEYRLAYSGACAYVWEPLAFTLLVRNPSNRARSAPATLDRAYSLECSGLASETRRLRESPRGERAIVVPANTTVRVPLPRSRFACCPSKAGSYDWRYRFEDSRGLVLWRTPPVRVVCREQPVRLPPGTTRPVADLLLRLAREPRASMASMNGYTSVEVSPTLKELIFRGRAAVPSLLANLDTWRIQYRVIEALGAIAAPESVPALIDHLWRQPGSLHDDCLLTALSRITGHPDGSAEWTSWWDPEGRAALLHGWRVWLDANPATP